MPDRAIPYYPVTMLCSTPIYSKPVLPEGYSFEFYRPELEEVWCQIQYSVRAFPSPEAAREYFEREFAPRPELLARRLIFACDRKRRAVATAALWHDHGMERIHWVAVVPGMTRRGIGKALVARLLEIYREEGCQNGLYLTSQTTSYRALNIYRKCGFVPDIGAQVLPEPQSEEEFRQAWRIIDERIAGYERRHGRGVEPDKVFSAALFFEKKSYFPKTSMCKVFEISAPNQSGDVPHYHDYLQIWYVTRGSCEHEVEGQTYTMNVGDVFFLPPKFVHKTTLGEGSSVLCCEFDLESVLVRPLSTYQNVKDAVENISFMLLFQRDLFNLQPHCTFSRNGQRQVERLLYSILDEYNAADLYFEDVLQLQILQLLVIFSREYSRLPVHEETEKVYAKYRSMVEVAIRYIDEHYDEPLTLDGMCRISMVSKTYFCYIFKLLTQKTFLEYLMERRIEHSMTLLRETDMSIIDIGHTVGFHEPTHFSRTFKKLRGISPREYRSSSR